MQQRGSHYYVIREAGFKEHSEMYLSYEYENGKKKKRRKKLSRKEIAHHAAIWISQFESWLGKSSSFDEKMKWLDLFAIVKVDASMYCHCSRFFKRGICPHICRVVAKYHNGIPKEFSSHSYYKKVGAGRPVSTTQQTAERLSFRLG